MTYSAPRTDFAPVHQNQSEMSPAACVALARETLAHARAFRESVRAFEQINMDKILGGLQAMREVSQGQGRGVR
ncbi:hypothetical protein [Insolitispirillum peregrinum]|uniref:hypothetical protein n=1 Tax=Insolitispirillum peregrinum TaxID=80876 RepID=UPI00360FC834